MNESKKVTACIDGRNIALEVSEGAAKAIEDLNSQAAKKIDRLTLMSAVTALIDEVSQESGRSFPMFIVDEAFNIGIFLDVELQPHGINFTVKNVISSGHIWCVSGARKAKINDLMTD